MDWAGIDEWIYRRLMELVDVLPMRFVKLVAHNYTDARVRKLYWRRLGLETVVMGEVKELCVEDGPALVASDHHMLQVVVEDLGGYPFEVAEGPDVAVHEALQGAALHELGIQGPAVT